MPILLSGNPAGVQTGLQGLQMPSLALQLAVHRKPVSRGMSPGSGLAVCRPVSRPGGPVCSAAAHDSLVFLPSAVAPARQAPAVDVPHRTRLRSPDPHRPFAPTFPASAAPSKARPCP